MVLPIVRPHMMKKVVPKERLDAIQIQLTSMLSQPSAIDASNARQFLSNYMSDLSMNALDPGFSNVEKPNGHSKNDNLTPSIALQGAALGLLEYLAATSTKSISSSLLIDTMIAYSGSYYRNRIQALVKTVLDGTPDLSQEILTALRTATQSCFGSRMPPNDTLQSLYRATRALALALHTSPASILQEFTSTNNAAQILMLVQIYDHLLPSIASTLSQSTRPIAQSLIRGDAEWARAWLETKISILDILQAAFSFVTSKTSSENTHPLTTFASTLMSAVQPPSQIHGKRILLVDSPLLADYERLFQLSETLRVSGWKDGGPTATFASFAEHLQIDRGVVQILIRSGVDQEKTPVVRPTLLPAQSDVKGKGKGKAIYEEPDPAIEEGLKTILGILPDQDPALVMRCLRHPNYSGGDGVERLMAALLEGTLPIELSLTDAERSVEDDVGEHKREDDVEEIIRGRANVFDALQVDLSSLRIGKKQDTADKLLDDSTWRQEIKADILRRAKEIAGEEEETRYGLTIGEINRRKFVPFDEDDFDDDFGDVSVVGDGETSDGEDEEMEEKVPVEMRIEIAYNESPALFDRDAATRRSAGRRALRLETGWSDEQIEGWKIMLDRNARKDKILDKHEPSGNKAAVVPHVDARGGGNGGARGGRGDQGRGRGRGVGRGASAGSSNTGGGEAGGARERGDGGGTRGRGGRGRAEGSNTERGRAWKEKNKSRGRQRGHDRKMAGGGGPA